MLPGWDSIESSAAFANWFTYAGFATLFLLGVFEVLAHIYSTHEKTLISQKELADSAIRDSNDKSKTRRLEEAESRTKKAEDAASSAEHIADEEKAARAPRTLKPEQQMDIATTLRPFAGQLFKLVTFVSDEECVKLSRNILDALHLAGWKEPPRRFETLIGAVVGVEVHILNKADARTRDASKALVQVLKKNGIVTNAVREESEEEGPRPSDEVGVLLGKKPQ